MPFGRFCVDQSIFEPYGTLEMRDGCVVILSGRGDLTGKNFGRN